MYWSIRRGTTAIMLRTFPQLFLELFWTFFYVSKNGVGDGFFEQKGAPGKEQERKMDCKTLTCATSCNNMGWKLAQV